MTDNNNNVSNPVRNETEPTANVFTGHTQPAAEQATSAPSKEVAPSSVIAPPKYRYHQIGKPRFQKPRTLTQPTFTSLKSATEQAEGTASNEANKPLASAQPKYQYHQIGKPRFQKPRTATQSVGNGTTNAATAAPSVRPQRTVRYQLQQKMQPKRETSSVIAPKIDAEQITPEEEVSSATRSKNSLKVMFLGGVGEIGKNIMVLEYGQDIIVLDAGSTFPSGEQMPGIDLVVPDITYLINNKDRVRGIVLTHGHEDHIGALPYILPDLQDVPVYGSKLTIALVENKLREFPKIKAKLITVNVKNIINLGVFSVEFIKVSHSIPDSMAFAITTPAGIMVHTGDFKIDFAPIDGVMTDLGRFAELGQKGVLLLTCESTNVERPGYSMSESIVGKSLDDLFAKNLDNRIFVATFASNIHRLQELLDLAEKYKRKVTFTGRSMLNVTETAYRIGELRFNRNNYVDLEKIDNYKDSELLVITTGSQGEPMSALTRMASGEFQKIKLGSHDTIIISANPIPGNEKMVNNVINSLYRLGCNVIYSSLAEIHASGHACRDELKTIHALVKPKFFIPVHGEYRHLQLHKNLAVEMGMEERNIIIAEVGSKIEVTRNSIKLAGTVPAGQRLVDGLGLGDIESIVLRDRIQLSEDGIAVVVMGMSGTTREITSGPDIISRGLIYSNEAEDLIKEARNVIIAATRETADKQTDWELVKNNVKRALGNYFYKKIKRRPMILTIVIEN